jgi:lauroyl/myristoyl acyltransferase
MPLPAGVKEAISGNPGSAFTDPAPPPASFEGGGSPSASGQRRLAFSYRLQGCGAALCFGALGLLSLEHASAIGGGLARLIGPRLGVSKRARHNLRLALPELSEAEIARTITGMWDNLGLGELG